MEILERRQPTFRLWACLMMLATLLLPRPVAAQGLTAPKLKAAFVYNFAKFAEWSAEALPQGQRLSLCIVGDAALAEALEQAVKGRGIDSHQLTVEVISADGPVQSCHVLYVSGLDRKQTGQLLRAVKSSPVLTISDGVQFAELGGVGQLISEGDHLRMAVNLDATKRAHLKISSKLLGLAQIVKDGPDAAR
ncbi:MAG: YfiR family protein [Acidobacteriota bacterium]